MLNAGLFLLGYRTVETERKNAVALLNLCMETECNYTDLSDDGEKIFFRCTFRTARKLRTLCEKRGIPLRLGASGGVPHFLFLHRRRFGLILGGICAVFLTVLSRQFVWDIRVTGNTAMTAGEIRRELAAGGLEIGSYLPSLDARAVENRVLLASDRLAWLSVHMDGTVAKVQVIERVAKPETVTKPANLVASADGQIESIELFRGKCLVSIGQPVRAGEILVSGLYDSETVGVRWTRAAGRILARTEHTFHIEIPFSYEEKQYTAEKNGEAVLNFFKFSVKISKNRRNDTDQCDIIEKVSGFDPVGLRSLPVSVTRQVCRFYQTVPAQRTPEEALERAYEELERQLAAFSGETQLLGKRITTSLTESALILDCTVECVENIAVAHEFEIEEVP